MIGERIENRYAFWDLMVQESWQTNQERLRAGDAEAFNRESAKSIYVFGCNEAAREFIRLFRGSLSFAGALDNAVAKWGTEFEGLKVYCPEECIPGLDGQKDVIVISMRLSADIVAGQISGLGFENYFSLAIMLSRTEPYAGWLKKTESIRNAPLQDIVMLESTNDLDGNSGALYEYLKKRGSANHFVWVLKNPRNKERLKESDGDEALCPGTGYEELMRFAELRAKAKWLIWDNTPIRKVRKGQVNVFLQHFGMGYKQISRFYRCPEYVDYVLTTNEFVRKMEQASICYPKTASFIYGELPRNDVLFHRGWRELEQLTDRHFDKVVLWAPTLRASMIGSRRDADIEYPYGVSLLYDGADMARLDEFLKALNMLLIIKPHPRQRLDFAFGGQENILYLYGEKAEAVHSYKLLTQMDAMITDYSSIVFDYMLLDRPCAWVLEDREHYKIEYLMEDPEEYMPGEKIYTLEELFRFLRDVSDGRDPYHEERRRICERCNPPLKGKGCERLVDALGL